MLRIGIVSTALLLLAGSAVADPIGLWLVTKGYARIRIENCNNAMWGAVAWEQRAGIDDKNPDASKRGRPTLGMPVLLDMKQTEQNKWSGQIYNSEDGKTYDSYIALASADVLKVRGCFIICMGEDWTRVVNEPPLVGAPNVMPGTAPRTATLPGSKPPGSATTPQQKPGTTSSMSRQATAATDPFDYETASADDFCSMILNGTRAPH